MDKRKLIFTSLIVLALVVAALSISYALNVAVTEGTSSEYDLSYTFDISDNATWTINVPAGKTKVYDISVTNPYNDIIKYGVVYKLDNPTTMPSNSLVGVLNTTENPSQGNINANSTLEISVAIVNNSSSNMQVTLGIVNGYKNGGDLIMPSGYALITRNVSLPYDIPSETLENGPSLPTTNFLSSSIPVASIESIEVVKKSEVPSGVSSPVDVSYDKTNNPNQVQLYSILNSSTSKYKVYLATESGKVSLSTANLLFHGMTSLKSIDLSNVYTNNIESMMNMFSSCSSLTSLDLSNFDTSNVTNMMYMFSGNSSLVSIDVSSFDTSSTISMVDMFSSCSSLKTLNLSNFDTSNVTSMVRMFSGASSLSTIYVTDSFVTTNVTGSSDMFKGCISLVGGNGTKFSSSNTDKGYAQIDTSDTTGYFTDITHKKIEPNSPDLVQGLIPVVYNGSKWVKADTTVTTQHATCDMLGDVNGDTIIDNLDITRAQRFLSGGNLSATSNPDEFLCADLNADGLITTEDLQLILSGKGTKVAAGTIGESVSGDVMGTNQWYDYNLKKWANAVLVTSTNRSTYQSASAGTEITESDILAYYVWIPRFKYKVWNISKQAGAESTYAYNAKTEGIDIVFESGKESTGTISCTYNYNVDSANGGVNLSTTTAETCTGNNGDYYTHPAFTFGTGELRGFWISKFEISSSNPTTTDGGGNVTNLTVRSLPNVNSWRNIQVSKISTVIQNMQTSSNIYGLNTSRANTDSHMLTNFEWGAVAYLTNSKYGRCTDGSCTEVTINNCSSYITGIGADTVSASNSSATCTTAANKYDGTHGKLASTTGNITGVYDMSGGVWEYTMGNISSVTTGYTFYPSSSSFASSWYTTDTAKYVTTYAYDKTNTTNQIAYNRGRLGDATSEVVLSTGSTGGWYSDYAYSPYSINAWFYHGGGHDNGSGAGVFSFYYSNGNYSKVSSSRAALVSFGA